MTQLDPGIRAGLLAAGGCEHTPQPWLACDTCGRPIPAWVLSGQRQVTAYDWQAKLLEGPVLEKRDLLSMDNVPRDRMVALNVATTSPRAPAVRVVVDPTKGEQATMFTRHFARVNARSGPGGAGGEKVAVVVVEVTPDPNKPDQHVRLYVHPDGIILSTQDLYF